MLRPRGVLNLGNGPAKRVVRMLRGGGGRLVVASSRRSRFPAC